MKILEPEPSNSDAAGNAISRLIVVHHLCKQTQVSPSQTPPPPSAAGSSRSRYLFGKRITHKKTTFLPHFPVLFYDQHPSASMTSECEQAKKKAKITLNSFTADCSPQNSPPLASVPPWRCTCLPCDPHVHLPHQEAPLVSAYMSVTSIKRRLPHRHYQQPVAHHRRGE